MKLTMCDECGGKYEDILVDETVAGVYLGKFPAIKCTKCGEVLFDEKTSRKMTATAKEKGVFGYALKKVQA